MPFRGRIDLEALKEEDGRSAARKRPIAIRRVHFQDLRAFPSTPVDYSYHVRYYDIGADHLPVSVPWQTIPRQVANLSVE